MNTPNWTKIVRDLLKIYTQVEIQNITGVHQGTISDLNNGKPKPYLSYTYGKALTDLHDKHFKQPEEA